MLRYLALAILLASVASAHDLLYKSYSESQDVELPHTIPIFKKIPAFKRLKVLSLPTQKSLTAHGNICKLSQSTCVLSNGKIGCCGYANGTCCSDKQHCCPQGHACNTKDGRCEILATGTSASVVCPDGQSQCPSGSTCCKLMSGQYGCCPLEKATCCADGVHCCPNGYKCDVSQGTCTRGDAVHAFIKTEVKSVVCPDGQSQCPSGSTCCKLKSGQYGCCPLQKATCCADGVHCCPNGYKCDVSQGTCTRGDGSASRLKVSSCCKVPFGGVLCCDGGLTCDQKSLTCVSPSSDTVAMLMSP